ncbi:MAG TPA: alpha/beta hydrolase [Novosphingobium sp.]|nr:alpha/beta hydrolase [Novosphingobium sp.]
MPVEKDIVCSVVNGRELRADVYRPEGGSVPTRTAVVLVHGGGWMLGDKGMIAPLAAAFAAQGFVPLSVEYRLVREAPWPAQLDDVVAAVNWVAGHAADLGIDPGRIVLGGASAGGHLALMATAKLGGKAKVAAVLSLFSASELCLEMPAPKGKFGAPQLVGPEASADALLAASPLFQVDAGFPPVFLLHGGADWMIDPQASINLYQRLAELGVTAEMHIVAGALHEFIEEPGMTAPMVAEMALFLDRVLIAPGKWAEETQASNLFAQGPDAVMALMQKLLAEG